MKAFIIAISGISGSGKTTVCRHLSSVLPKTGVVSLDDYLGLQIMNRNCLSDDGFNSLDMTAFLNAADAAARKSKYDCVLLDYPLGRCHSEVNKIIDFVFFLDAAPDIALARKISWSLKYENEEKAAQKLRLYRDYGYKVARKIIEQARPAADVVVSANHASGLVIEELREFISCLLSNYLLF